jgi:uncharacterized protein (TIGR04255 family)
MPIPVSDRKVYAQNPIRECICQFRFHDILKIVAETPVEFQEQVRTDYPVYRDASTSVVFEGHPNIPEAVKAAIVRQLPTEKNYQFLTEDFKHRLILDHRSLTLSTSKYTTWEPFSKRVEEAEKALRGVYNPARYTRLGLRYINCIVRSELGLEMVPWKELIKPQFAGLMATEVAQEVASSKSEVQLNLGPESATARVIYGLQEVKTKSKRDELGFLFDVDFSTMQLGKADTGDFRQFLDRVHGLAGCLFRWAISERLEDALCDRLQ